METYLALAYTHLFTVLPAFFIGTYMMFARKGSAHHKLLGKIYMGLMLFTAIVTLFMPAFVGPTVLGHFGFIHLFSVLVLVTVPKAYKSAKIGDVIAHRNSMIGMYVGAMLIAGGFAMMPGRMLYGIFFG